MMSYTQEVGSGILPLAKATYASDIDDKSILESEHLWFPNSYTPV